MTLPHNDVKMKRTTAIIQHYYLNIKKMLIYYPTIVNNFSEKATCYAIII